MSRKGNKIAKLFHRNTCERSVNFCNSTPCSGSFEFSWYFGARFFSYGDCSTRGVEIFGNVNQSCTFDIIAVESIGSYRGTFHQINFEHGSIRSIKCENGTPLKISGRSFLFRRGLGVFLPCNPAVEEVAVFVPSSSALSQEMNRTAKTIKVLK